MDFDALTKELTRDEGRVPHAYQDSLRYWTIGIGHLIDQRMGGKLDDEVIDLQFHLDVNKCCNDLDAHVPWWRSLDEVRQRVMVNLCFNLGIIRLMGFHHFLAALEIKAYPKAAEHLKDSEWHKQVGPRALRLEQMILTGTV